jgi:hypothetical protein
MNWWNSDTNLARGLKVLLFFAVFAGLLTYFGYQIMNEATPKPCSPAGFPGRCYHVNDHICDITWRSSEAACKDVVKKLNLPPGRLIEPIITRCQLVKLDEAFSVSRKSTPECDDMHRELDEWKKRNGF